MGVPIATLEEFVRTTGLMQRLGEAGVLAMEVAVFLS